jgi:Ca-activated chloride channel homolog
VTFAHPYLLLLLLLLPLAAWLKGRRGQPPAFLYSSEQLLRGLVKITPYNTGGFLMALRWLVLALLIVALAQPRLSKSETKIKASGVDIMVALDLSGSMVAEDFVLGGNRVNRLNMARKVLEEFIEKRPNDRIGLAVFATQSYIATPLTLDHEFLNENLNRLQLGTIPADQTAIGSGLSTALNCVRKEKSKSKIIILMTDGQNNAGRVSPLTAAEAAKALGVKVYTIGVGTRGMAPVPAGRNPFTGQIVYNQVQVDIDEDTLNKIAEDTGGKYYRADNAERFQAIYTEIDKLEKTDAEVKKYTHHKELFPWVAGLGLSLLLLEVALGQTVLRRLP